MNDKITQLKPKKKVPIYYIICEGNRNPIGQTYNIDSARMLRDQLEDLWIDYWNCFWSIGNFYNSCLDQ